MSHQENRKDQVITDYSELRNNSQRQFGKILRELCEMSGFTQGKLAREAKKERKRLLDKGYINPGDLIGSMEQPTVSRVLAGVQEPTYFQVYIWLRVVRKHYESSELAEICQKLGIDRPEFPAETERLLWALTSFRPPEELAQAYEESKSIPPMKYRSIIDHKETRMTSRYISDVPFPAHHRTRHQVDDTEELPVLSDERIYAEQREVGEKSF